ncbi:MAG: DNA repair protein RecN [Deltaproteobacteria bacterium]|nr:DNA repair protein RecN [Deltaproteobacteria bacterium]
MLQELSIKNFAIIDDLRISFSEGLTILSGETGAGKSIILQAVNLLLGSRAGAAMIRSGAEAAELEALFFISPESRTAAVMASHGYDPSEGLLIRRIISITDRHRIFVNGRLATIQVLAAITESLASISGQHAHQGLLKEDQHLLTLDQFGGLTRDLLALRNEVYAGYHAMLPLIQNLHRLQTAALRQSERIDLLSFQKNEISEAHVHSGEDSELEKDRNRLKHAGMLYQAVQDSIENLYGGSGAVSERLSTIRKTMDKAAQIDPGLASFSASLADAVYRIEDIVEGLRTYLHTIETDEGRLDAVDARIDFLHKLKRKYGGSLDAVLARLTEIEKELFDIEHLSGTLEETQTALARHHVRLCQVATTLSSRRAHAAAALAQRVETELGALKMPHTRFEIALRNTPADNASDPFLTCEGKVLAEYGVDRAVFLIAPNPGEALKPLSQIASGGELSRVVLALKAILSSTDSVETVIFDEVDSGIGGGVAEVVGKKLLDLSRHHQVICITHLPQIARFGNHHFRITKNVQEGRTSTTIQALNPEDRVHELARMLGGETLTPAAWEHARELLESS